MLINYQSKEERGGGGMSLCQAMRCEGSFQWEFFSILVSETQTILAFWRQYIKLEKMLHSLRSEKNIYEQREGICELFCCVCCISFSRYSQHQIKPAINSAVSILREENYVC